MEIEYDIDDTLSARRRVLTIFVLVGVKPLKSTWFLQFWFPKVWPHLIFRLKLSIEATIHPGLFKVVLPRIWLATNKHHISWRNDICKHSNPKILHICLQPWRPQSMRCSEQHGGDVWPGQGSAVGAGADRPRCSREGHQQGEARWVRGRGVCGWFASVQVKWVMGDGVRSCWSKKNLEARISSRERNAEARVLKLVYASL